MRLPLDCFLPFRRCVALTCAGVLLSAGIAFAHDPGLSSANLQIGAESIALQLTFNERDVASIARSSSDEFHSAAWQARLQEMAARAVVLTSDGIIQRPSETAARVDENQNVEFRYAFAKPNAPAELLVDSVLLKELPFGHRQAFAARDLEGRELARKILSARESVARVSLGGEQIPAKSGTRFLEFFSLGIRHILTGYDHLLFLFGLLIVCRTSRSALLLITCFTLAHSLTLALSTFGLVNLPSRFVEATIAASIVYVGVENLLRRDMIVRARALLTFGFGLIHGLGFASVLREMGIARTGVAAIVPLVAFNGGVEVGQLAVAAVVLPAILLLRRRPPFLQVGVPACSLLVAAAGAYWLIERIFFS